MAPRTRRSHTATTDTHPNGASDANGVGFKGPTRTYISTQRDAIDPDLTQPGVRGRRAKRTFASSDTLTSAPSTTPAIQANHANSSKRSRVSGPAHKRPMPLRLNGEGELMSPAVSDGAMNGEREKQVPLQRVSSYYPNRGDTTHALASLDPENFIAHDSDTNDDILEDEDDWFKLEDEHIADNATRKVSARTSEAILTERPSWREELVDATSSRTAPSSHGSAVSTPRSMPVSELASGTPTAELSAAATTLQRDAPKSNRATRDTDLVFPPGVTKLMLTSQQPLIRAVIQDAFENMRASLMFNNAFPDGILALALAKESVIIAADNLKPGTAVVQRRLEADDEYLARMAQPLRARIPIFRSEAKERCSAIVGAELLAIGRANGIAEAACWQLSAYHYTFPISQSGLLTGIPRRTRPYRNKRVITVIRDMFFSGGKTSFVSRFHRLFPVHEDDKGVQIREVPVPMVALVATALYAALHEWRTGRQQAAEFSTNAYLDVYNGHVNTFGHIKEHRTGAYHVMMADIYSQANCSDEDNNWSSAPIADLDLSVLED